MASEPIKIPEPIQIVIEQKVEEPVETPKLYTLEEKIKLNVNECDESTQYIRADDATCLVKPVYVPPAPQSTVRTAVNQSERVYTGGLIGSYGSVRHYGNCVNEPGVNNPGQGNPITWAVTSRTPTVGATALWTYNHTGVVTGIYEGGEYVEVRHQNYSGSRTKFHISEFRGFR